MMTNSPYPGLRPFTDDEAHVFFGRDEQTIQLLEKLSETRFIALLGQSGCGKSSLVRAGMIPGLKSGFLPIADSDWQIITMRPGNSPMNNLAEAFLASTDSEYNSLDDQPYIPLPQDAKEAFLIATLSRGPLGLIEALRETQFSKEANILILVDQFEELFRLYHQKNIDETIAFVSLLLHSIKQQEIPIYVVITLRSEFFGESAFFRGLPEMLNAGQFLVPRMTRDQQRMAIVGPAAIFDSTVDTLLVNRLLNDTGTDPDQLPVLQHCLMRMWQQAVSQTYIDKETLTITLEDYENVGRLTNALSYHVEEAYNKLNEHQKKIAEIMFRCLCERSPNRVDIRRSVQLSEVAAVADVSISQVIEVAEVFRHPDRCFLTPSYPIPLIPQTILDISHESLVRRWNRLNQWVEIEAESAKSYQRLEQSAILWKEGMSALLRSPDLEIALKWKDEHPTSKWAQRFYGGNFELAMEFLGASQQNELHRKGRLRRVLSLFLITIIALLSSFTGWAFWERTKAEQAFQVAEAQRQNAELSSSIFQEMVITTFGFLSDSRDNTAFLDWIKVNSSIERFIPALSLMVKLSEAIPEEQKSLWQKELTNMSEAETLELFNILGLEAARRVMVKDDFSIRQIIIEDESGQVIPFVDGVLILEPLQRVVLKIEVENPSNYSFGIQLQTIAGNIEANAVYIAPITYRQDLLNLRAIESETDKVLTQTIISIDIKKQNN